MNEYKQQIKNLKVERDTLVAVIRMLTGGKFSSKFDRLPVTIPEFEVSEDEAEVSGWNPLEANALVSTE